MDSRINGALISLFRCFPKKPLSGWCLLYYTILPVRSYTNTKTKRRAEGMKYVVFWEYDKKYEAAIIEKFNKRPEAEMKRLTPPYVLGGQTKGFSLYEEENFEQLEKFIHHYTPLLKTKIYPILELTTVVKNRKY